MTEPASPDERIVAFLDGALDDDAQAAFEAELASNSALAAEVERMLANDSLLREAFDGPMAEGADDALLARMGLAQPAAPVIDLDSRRPAEPKGANDNTSGWSRWRLPLSGGIVAALALMVTFGLGDGDGSSFDAALDTTPSGQIAALADGSTLTPVLSFRAGDGRFCREFSLGSGAAGGSGVACRGDGGWKIEALDQGATQLARSDEIQVAGGADASDLDAAYDRLAAGDPLTGEVEQALITSHWKNAKQ
jgi:hypothetical protein